MGWRGVLTGSIGLVALYLLVANAERTTGLLAIPGDLARRFLDPTVPAIGAAPSSSSSGGSLADELKRRSSVSPSGPTSSQSLADQVAEARQYGG